MFEQPSGLSDNLIPQFMFLNKFEFKFDEISRFLFDQIKLCPLNIGPTYLINPLLFIEIREKVIIQGNGEKNEVS